MTTSVSAPLTQAEQIFKTLIWDPMILAGENWLVMEEASVPVLDLLSGLQKEVVQTISDWFFAKIVLFIDLGSIRLINAAHQAAYVEASVGLIAIAHQHGTSSQEYKNAQDAALAALSQFTHFN